MNNTLLQPAAFLVLAYGGSLAGLCYDALRLIRRIFRGRLMVTLCDGVFVLCAAGVLIISLLYATGGTIRPYLLVGYFSGFFLEQWSVSSLFFRLFHSILGKRRVL